MQVFNLEMKDSEFPFNKLNKMVISQFNGHEKNSPSELGPRKFWWKASREMVWLCQIVEVINQIPKNMLRNGNKASQQPKNKQTLTMK